ARRPPMRSRRAGRWSCADTLRRDVICPGKEQCDWKSDQQQYNYQAERPAWQFPRGENRRTDLNNESRGDDVSGGNSIHLSPLHFLEEAAHNVYRPIMTIAGCCEFETEISMDSAARICWRDWLPQQRKRRAAVHVVAFEGKSPAWHLTARDKSETGLFDLELFSAESPLNERLEARMAVKRIEPGIDFNESEVIAVALLVSLFEQVDGGILFVEPDVDQREIER